MTDQEINVAIHEARGLCPHTVTKCDSGFTCVKCGKNTYGDKLPSYTTDLNAMQLAVATLGDLEFKFGHELMRIVHPEPVMSAGAIWTYCCRAKAREWAEAFLRTLGKWKE